MKHLFFQSFLVAKKCDKVESCTSEIEWKKWCKEKPRDTKRVQKLSRKNQKCMVLNKIESSLENAVIFFSVLSIVYLMIFYTHLFQIQL